ncbi:hypothetical protein GCM10027051_01010 [Niabella terrae]
MVRTISVLDTSIATQNVGDEIIMDAVYNELAEIFNHSMFLRIPTHEIIGRTSLSLIRNSELGIVGGSNILSSAMNRYRQWKLSLWQSYLIRNKILLLGVGWRNYQDQPNFITKRLLKNILHNSFVHSVRDSYTENKLKKEGFVNVINTSCPTMWRLTPEHCERIPTNKSDTVIFTLTDYSKSPEIDRFLVSELLANYSRVFFWIQSRKDLLYLNELDLDLSRIKVVDPTLKDYDAFLNITDCDYIGTRLHGGIRALQKGRRAIIIGVDNRAIEKQKDFNLNVINRGELVVRLNTAINDSFETKISIPQENIAQWKAQFFNNKS